MPLVIFDSEAMYEEVYQLKAQAYRAFDGERTAMEMDLEEFQSRVPSRNELGKYINHMKDLMGKQHTCIAKVAAHLQKSQQIAYESLTKHTTDAFQVCNRVLTGAFQSLPDSMRQIRRDVPIAVTNNWTRMVPDCSRSTRITTTT